MHAYDGIMTKTMKFKRHFCTNWLLSEASTEEEDRTGYRSYLSRKEKKLIEFRFFTRSRASHQHANHTMKLTFVAQDFLCLSRSKNNSSLESLEAHKQVREKKKGTSHASRKNTCLGQLLCGGKLLERGERMHVLPDLCT